MDNKQRLQDILGDKYDVQEMIYRGGMGEIYQGLHRRLGAKVAIKIMIQKLTDDPELKKRFHREAQLYASLRHPNIIHIYDFGTEDAFDYMVFPFIDGETLQQKLKREGRLDSKDALNLLISVARALAYASEHNVIHRDVKPSNIMIEGNGNVLITDFGISKDLTDLEITLPGTVLGSPKYMSPEQILGKPVDSRADQYALGIIGYEILAGKYPFDANNPSALFYSHIHETPELPEDIIASVHPEFIRVLRKMISKESGERYDGFTDLIDELTVIQFEQTEIRRRPMEVPVKPKNGSAAGKYILAVAGIAFVVLLGVVGADLFLSPREGVDPSRVLTGTPVASLESPAPAAHESSRPPETKEPEEPAGDRLAMIETSDPPDPGEIRMAAAQAPDLPPTVALIREMMFVLGDPDISASFRIGLNQSAYRIGEKITYAIQSDRDCHAVLFDFTTAGELIQLFPNRFNPDSQIRANTIYHIPAEGSFEVTGPAGSETIVGYVAASPLAILENTYESGPFPFVTDADRDALERIYLKILDLNNIPLIRERIDFQITN